MKDTVNTSVTIAGVEFKNPIITASGTFGFGREYGEFYDINVLGGICTKGLTLEKRQGNPGPRVAETPMGMLNSVGLQNPGLEDFLKDDLGYLQSLDTVVIVNVAGRTEEDYIAVAERISDTALPMIELNISCPNVKAGGMAFGIYPDSVERITKAVRAHCRKPLIVKLSPNVASIADNARAAENGGADAISLINTLTGMAVDWRARRTVLANRTGGLSGPGGQADRAQNGQRGVQRGEDSRHRAGRHHDRRRRARIHGRGSQCRTDRHGEYFRSQCGAKHSQ